MGGGGSNSREPMHTKQRMRKDLGVCPAPIAQNSEGVGITGARGPEVEDVEVFAFKSGWDQVDGENEIVALPCPCTPCSNAETASHR